MANKPWPIKTLINNIDKYLNIIIVIVIKNKLEMNTGKIE